MESPDSGRILVDRTGHITTVTVSRPTKLNSVTQEMLESFDRTVTELLGDPDVRVVVFTGDGDRAFSAGFDLTTVQSLQGDARYRFFKLLESSMARLSSSDSCITIAAVNGYAIGFGAILAISCDLRFFSEDAVFRLPEVELDILPAAGAASPLVDLVGVSRAKDILLSGRALSAQEAYGLGLANRVVPRDMLMDEVREYAAALLSRDWWVVLHTKRMLDDLAGRTPQEATRAEGEYLERWLQRGP